MSHYDSDDAYPKSPGLQPIKIKSTPSPSPPPFPPQHSAPVITQTGDTVLLSFLEPNRPDIARAAGERALDSDSDSDPEASDSNDESPGFPVQGNAKKFRRAEAIVNKMSGNRHGVASKAKGVLRKPDLTPSRFFWTDNHRLSRNGQENTPRQSGRHAFARGSHDGLRVSSRISKPTLRAKNAHSLKGNLPERETLSSVCTSTMERGKIFTDYTISEDVTKDQRSTKFVALERPSEVLKWREDIQRTRERRSGNFGLD